MTFDDVFNAFYRLYRAEAEVPASTDDEYTIAMELANEAIRRWARYDNTYWKELFTTLVDSGEGTTIVTDQVDYECPDDFREGGGSVRVIDTDDTTLATYPIINPEDVQFRDTNSTYSFFFGNPSDGYTLRLNPAPTSTINGKRVQYDYYKSPTEFTTGTDIAEIPQPDFIVHRVLANRLRASRNPYYNSALRDAEDVLKTMQLQNNSGTWANPFKLQDRSGSVWGA